jgi:hypothetical protein
MQSAAILLKGSIDFKIRFNTTHGDTNLYWRVIIDEKEYLVSDIQCQVYTFSDRSFDKKANAIKYHIAGQCKEFIVGNDMIATFK